MCGTGASSSYAHFIRRIKALSRSVEFMSAHFDTSSTISRTWAEVRHLQTCTHGPAFCIALKLTLSYSAGLDLRSA